MRCWNLLLVSVISGMWALTACGGAGGGSNPDSIPPEVSFVDLQDEQVVQGTVYLTLSAQDNQKVVKVEIYVDRILLGVLPPNTSGYLWDTKREANGLHTLKARAYDSSGNAGEAGLTVVVANPGAPDTTPPAVQWAEPLNHQSVSGNVPLRAYAFDDNRVVYVDFFIDSALVFRDSTSPYEYLWQSESYANGEHTLKVKAYDVSGNVTEATITVATANPEPDATPPTFEGVESATAVDETSVRLSWRSAEDDRIPSSWMVYLICRSSQAGACQQNFRADYTTEPGALSFVVNLLLPDTSYFFVVRARDSAGNVESNRVEKSATTLKDILPPQVRITSPANGSAVSGMVSIMAEVSDNSFCIQQVQFGIDGAPTSIAYFPPYTYLWNTNFEREGNHTISAYAEDCSGNAGIETITVVVQKPVTTGSPEAVTLVANGITQTSAVLNGGVKPNGLATTAYFEWGPSPSYGNTTPPQDMGSGRDFVSLSFSLTGLSPNTLYHYRVVASNSRGTAYGENVTFLTGIQPPTPMKKIAYFNYTTGPRDEVGLYVMNEDGSGVKRIARTSFTDHFARWSPDGKKIAYADTFPSYFNSDIFVVNEDGTGWKNLTNTPEEWEGRDWTCDVAWSPDGAKILFNSIGNPRLRSPELYVMNADGSDRKCLTCDMEIDRKSIITSCAYSPDGSKIAFGLISDLWIMNADGSNKKKLYHSSSTTDEGFPSVLLSFSFTLDGTHLIFLETDEWDTIYSIEVETGRLERLTPPNTYGGFPYLSPDGKKIAFVRCCVEGGGLYVMNVDGSQLREIGSNLDVSCYYSWSPDSQKIAYDAIRGPIIKVIEIDGNFSPRVLDVHGLHPAWQP